MRFRADFESRGDTLQTTVGNLHILAGPVFGIGGCVFQNDTVVRRHNMATLDPHTLAVVGVDAIRIRKFQVVENAQIVRVDITATGEVQGPIRRIAESQVAHGNALDVLEAGHGRTPGKRGTENMLLLAESERTALAINRSRSRQCDVVAVFRPDPVSLVGFLARTEDKSRKVLDARGAAQDGALCYVKVDARAEFKRSGQNRCV